MSNIVKDNIITARVKLLFQQPFFGNIATRLKLVENDTFVKTAATDGRSLYYNNEFFKSLTTENIVFVVAHEILHVVFNHMDRKEYRDKRLFNIACDFAVNGILIRDKIGTPPKLNICYDKKFDGMSAEQIYDILLIELPKISCNTLDDHLDWSEDSADQNGDQPRYTSSELEDLRNEVINNILQAYQTCSNAGKIPGEIERLITNLTEPKMDWRQVIRCNVQSLVKNDFSWARPSRKSWHLPAILPGVKFDETIDVAVALDMSGSMTDEQAQTVLSEVAGLVEQYADFTLNIWSFDTEVYNHTVYTPDISADIGTYVPKGGGGTDFMVNWEFMEQEGIMPKLFIMFTDGYCNHRGFGNPEYCDTLFIMIDSTVVAPFGDTVHYS